MTQQAYQHLPANGDELQLKGLIYVGALRAAAGATPEEQQEFTAAIRRLRLRLGTKGGTTVKPSARRRSSATYCGATQMLGTFVRRMRVVSGGGSAYADFDPIPGIPATPAIETMRRNLRRLSRMVHVLPSHHRSSALRCEREGRVVATLCLRNPGVYNLLPQIRSRSNSKPAIRRCSAAPPKTMRSPLLWARRRSPHLGEQLRCPIHRSDRRRPATQPQ